MYRYGIIEANSYKKKKIDINKNRISGQSDKKENMDIYIYETRKKFSIVKKNKTNKTKQVHSYQHDHFGFMTFTYIFPVFYFIVFFFFFFFFFIEGHSFRISQGQSFRMSVVANVAV